jgi:alkanesulfonate monooxygenase SsuD/methylene tetrahydromethanopterin reductase-like flavin-dependent oxidoreductase (luciferase family)
MTAPTTPPTTIGVVALPTLPPEELRALAEAADDAGLAELWLWEDCFFAGGMAAAATALAATRRLRVGVGVLPVPLRAVTLTAMEIAALERLATGRFVTGLGHGVQEWMGQAGVRAESPLTLLREYVGALRDLLAGDEVSAQGRYVRLDRVRLTWPAPGPVRLHVGTEGPRSLRLAGEVADGTILTGGTGPDAVRAALAHVEQGRRDAGRGALRDAQDPHRVTVYLRCAAGPDAVERLEADRRRWDLPAGHDFGVAGDAETVAAGVRALADAGADAVVLQPTQDDPDPLAFARFAALEVAPLV